MKKREYRFPRQSLPNGEGKEEAASPQKRKPTPPRCAQQPLPREGARVGTPSFLWKEVPRRGGGWMGGSGMKESEEMHLKSTINESTAISASLKRIHACVEKQYPRQSLPRVGQVASGASRIGFWWYEREGRLSQVEDKREHPIHRCAVPLPQWGRQRGGGFAAPKRKPTPPRCARQPLPREGARVDTPSFLWKEVPRRGGGWIEEAG